MLPACTVAAIAGGGSWQMDTEALHHRRHARRRALRRRRRAGGVILAIILAALAIILVSRPGASAPTAAKARTARASGQAHPRGGSAAASTSAAGTSAAGTPVAGGPPGTRPVPILMYHVIAAPPPGAPFPGLYVTPSEFAAQMQALKRAGWRAVTLDQLEANWRSGAPLGSGKPIVLSFDNGYQSQFTSALPVLRGLGWVGDENIQLSGLPPSQGGLGPAQVRGLIAAGWELDTQGFSHADLITLDARQLHYQVADARTVLQQRYHVPVNWFCYPSGHYDATVIAAVKSAGYTGSTTVVPGWAHPADDPYRLHRLRVLGGTSPEALLALIASVRSDPPAPPSYGGD
jgi:peptidoglycan/xylan/chitin deacetylase (PgdA/CDA1 family)